MSPDEELELGEEEERRGGRRRLPPLASPADVEAITGVDLDPAAEARVSRLLDMASAAVRAWTHQTISLVREHTVTIPSSGTELLLLAELPVRGVSHVNVSFGVDWWWTEESETVLAMDPGGTAWDLWGRFSWDAAGRLRRLDGMTWGLPNDPVSVTYSHGWRRIPADIVGVVAGKVAVGLTASAANPEGLRSVTIGDYTRAFADPTASAGALNDSDKAILERYRARSTAAALGTL